jgi:hypothetical protein
MTTVSFEEHDEAATPQTAFAQDAISTEPDGGIECAQMPPLVPLAIMNDPTSESYISRIDVTIMSSAGKSFYFGQSSSRFNRVPLKVN